MSIKHFFETFFLPKKASWIKSSKESDSIFCFAKSFIINEEVEYAKLMVCGLGFYNFKINNHNHDKDYFVPSYTDYCIRNINRKDYFPANKYTIVPQYYDVTKDVKIGDNKIFIYVGNGYFQNTDKYLEPDFNYGGKKLIFELVIFLKNKQIITVFSNGETDVQELSRKSTLYCGDSIDFTVKSAKVVKALEISEKMGNIVSDNLPHDTVNERINPTIYQKNKNSIIYDFGKNHSGGLSLIVKGKKGHKITVYYAEVSNPDGTLNFETSVWKENEKNSGRHQEIYQKSEYILSGGIDHIKPLFCWRCYRYVEIEGIEEIEIKKIYSNFLSEFHINELFQ